MSSPVSPRTLPGLCLVGIGLWFPFCFWVFLLLWFNHVPSILGKLDRSSPGMQGSLVSGGEDGKPMLANNMSNRHALALYSIHL